MGLGVPLALFAAVIGQVPTPAAPAVIQARLAELRATPETAPRLGAESRLLFFAAEATEETARKAALHADGRAAAERALRLDPREPSAMLWWAAHRGSEASLLDPLTALRIAREVEEMLLRLRALDPAYDHAAADRALGRLYQVAPRGISVGSLEKAGEHLRAAIRQDAAFPGNALFYAQYLAATKDCDGAREWANKVLASPALVDYPLERGGWVADARRLLASLRMRCLPEEKWP